MKRAECDQCKALADADPHYGNAPATWVHVTYNPTGYKPAKDFCSVNCAMDWLADQVPHEKLDLTELDKAMALPTNPETAGAGNSAA